MLENVLFKKTTKRLARCGINDPTSQIIALAEEIERYREQIKAWRYAEDPLVGRWEEWRTGDCAIIMTGEEMLYQCTVCTAKYSDVENFRYCPHCGAFMNGGAE